MIYDLTVIDLGDSQDGRELSHSQLGKVLSDAQHGRDPNDSHGIVLSDSQHGRDPSDSQYGRDVSDSKHGELTSFSGRVWVVTSVKSCLLTKKCFQLKQIIIDHYVLTHITHLP